MNQFLQIFTNRRVGITFLLGFSSAIPLPLVFGTLDAWMASEKVSLATIGLFSLVQLPYSVKFLWSPLLDRFNPPFLHRRTGWILIFQILLVFGIAALGMTNPVSAPMWTAILALIVAFLSASQDIVIDAYRAEVLREKELGAGAAMGVAGARIGLIVSGAVALILSDYISWAEVYQIMAIAMGVGILASFLGPQPDKVAPPPPNIRAAVIEPFHEYFRRDRALLILVAIILFKLGDAVAGKMTTPFLIQLGFSKGEVGSINKGFGMFMTIFGAVWGGAVLAKIGIVRSLITFGILQALSNLVFVAQAYAGLNHTLLFLCIGVENLCGGMGTAAFVAFLMKLCNIRYTATQYALLSSIMAITRTLAGVPTGYMAESLGWPMFFIMSAVISIPGILILFKLPDIEKT